MAFLQSFLYHKKKHQPEHSIITKVRVYTGNWDRILEIYMLFLVLVGGILGAPQDFELSFPLYRDTDRVFPCPHRSLMALVP